jgi:hypothetical protein
MPITNTVADILIEDAESFTTVLVKARPEDVELIRNVFPEAGVQTYLAGCFMQKLADKLRQEGVTDVSDRIAKSSFKTIKDIRDYVQFRKPPTTRK